MIILSAQRLALTAYPQAKHLKDEESQYNMIIYGFLYRPI